MKWYETIAVSILFAAFVYVIIAPWLSIMDIHKSIDKVANRIAELTDEIDKLTDAVKERSDDAQLD